MNIPSILLFSPFWKSFVKASTYTTKKGRTVHRKAYTDSRKAKEFKASDKVRSAWTKNKTYNQVKDELHSRRKKLHENITEARKHLGEIEEAKKSDKTHSKRGIKVEHAHHVARHHDNLMEKLDHVNNKIMLHDNAISLMEKPERETKGDKMGKTKYVSSAVSKTENIKKIKAGTYKITAGEHKDWTVTSERNTWIARDEKGDYKQDMQTLANAKFRLVPGHNIDDDLPLKWQKKEKGEYMATHGEDSYVIEYRKKHKWEWVLTVNLYNDIRSSDSKKSLIDWINKDIERKNAISKT